MKKEKVLYWSSTSVIALFEGVNFQTFFPFVVLGILVVSYINYHKLNQEVK